MKTSTQLKAQIRNLAKIKHVEAEIILRNFMLERFLERVSASAYKSKFILKGGMLIATVVGIDSRTTMDMDATIKGQRLDELLVRGIIENVLSIPVNDDVVFSLQSIEEIREEADYPGYRVSLEATLDKTRQRMHLDLTSGDSVTPREIEYGFRLLFEDRTISIMAYNLESVLAEKFESIITRGLTNTRMRDFYDIYILTSTQNIDFDIFRAALNKTATKRKTIEQLTDAAAVIDHVAKSQIMAGLWSRYQKNYGYAANVTWESANEALRDLASSLT